MSDYKARGWLAALADEALESLSSQIERKKLHGPVFRTLKLVRETTIMEQADLLTAAAERERVLQEALHTAGRCIKELDGYGKPRPSSPSVETVLGTIRAALEAK